VYSQDGASHFPECALAASLKLPVGLHVERAVRHFREHALAASLKHEIDGRALRLRRNFRERALAASLKHDPARRPRSSDVISASVRSRPH
jgi:hypothetical protein